MTTEVYKTYRRMARIGVALMIIGFVFAVIETVHFRSEFLPESNLEFFCDFTAAFVCGGGSFLFLYAIASYSVIKVKEIISSQ